jgi:hypothetical protein
MPPKDTLMNLLCNEAKKSVVDQQLAAAIIKSGKIVSKPSCNTARNLCRGAISGSLHAEARAIINYYGNAISFDRKKGWCVQRSSIKKFKT